MNDAMNDKIREIEIPWNEVPEEIRELALIARKNFLVDEFVQPVLIVEGRDGQQVFDLRELIPDKTDVLEQVMIKLARSGARLLVVISEAWMAAYRDDHKHNQKIEKLSRQRRLKDAPGRIEVINVSAETPEAWYSLRAKIQRDRKLKILDFDCWRISREEMDREFAHNPATLQNIFRKAGV